MAIDTEAVRRYLVWVTFTDVPEGITFGVDEKEVLRDAVDVRKQLPAVSQPAAGQKTVA